MTLRRILVATCMAGLSATLMASCPSGASAADIARPVYAKAPAAAAAVFDWSGFYLGGDIGGIAQTVDGTSNFRQSNLAFTNNRQSNSLSSSGALGGLHLGYNWKIASGVLVGIEGDWQWTGAKSSFCRQTDALSEACRDLRGFLTIEDATRDIATLRGRLGYAFDRVMIFGTAGAAFVDVRGSITADCRLAGCGVDGLRLLSSANISGYRTGWVAGAGLEWMVSPNWIVRGEYLHIDAGTISSELATCSAASPCSASWSRSLQYDIGRVGFSYRFGSGP